MSFPVIKKGSGSGGDGSDKKSISLHLSENMVLPAPAISIIPFDAIDNNGMQYNQATGTVTVPDAGKLVITASIGALTGANGTYLTTFLFKNGVYLRQHAAGFYIGAPYATAEVSMIDSCAAGDEYQIYATVGGTDGDYTIGAENGLTGFELSYL